jgi:hypothetical protein
MVIHGRIFHTWWTKFYRRKLVIGNIVHTKWFLLVINWRSKKKILGMHYNFLFISCLEAPLPQRQNCKLHDIISNSGQHWRNSYLNPTERHLAMDRLCPTLFALPKFVNKWVEKSSFKKIKFNGAPHTQVSFVVLSHNFAFSDPNFYQNLMLDE